MVLLVGRFCEICTDEIWGQVFQVSLWGHTLAVCGGCHHQFRKGDFKIADGFASILDGKGGQCEKCLCKEMASEKMESTHACKGCDEQEACCHCGRS
jgi:hypothetical protein